MGPVFGLDTPVQGPRLDGSRPSSGQLDKQSRPGQGSHSIWRPWLGRGGTWGRGIQEFGESKRQGPTIPQEDPDPTVMAKVKRSHPSLTWSLDSTSTLTCFVVLPRSLANSGFILSSTGLLELAGPRIRFQLLLLGSLALCNPL